nr:hypothetical protein [Tanacetum cinerariifolium]
MRNKESASWVKGTGSHGVLGEVNGTVQVDVGVRERSYRVDGKKAGNVVVNYIIGPWTFDICIWLENNFDQ